MAPLPFLAESMAAQEPAAIARVLAYFAGVLVLVTLAKLGRDRLALGGGRKLSELIRDRNNTPVAIELGGFTLSMVIGLLGSIVVEPGVWWEEALWLAATGGVVFAVLAVNDQLVTRLLLGGIDCNRAVAEDHNLAVAIVRAGGSVGAALALRGALGHESPFVERLVWVLIGQVMLVVMVRGYQWLTPYDDVAEIRHKNVAAALPMVGIFIAVGLVIGAAMTGEGVGWGADLLALAVDLSISASAIVILRWAGDRLLLPGTSYAEEIARDKNAGVGFIEASVYVSAALAVTYFLN